ncbi:MAG TPA: ABC transporter permease [Anaerolineae bacterium]|nr:ABC transporter permease [Anaerolineae bacterium]
MAVSELGSLAPATTAVLQSSTLVRWNSPWLNRKLIAGATLLTLVILFGLIGPFFWSTRLALVASSPTTLPPMWVQSGYQKVGTAAHPLGSDSNGRDMLAVIMVATPSSLQVGLIAAGIGLAVAMLVGSMAGYLGGRFDDVARTLSDSWIIIPPLAVLVVLMSVVRVVDLMTMALVLALFTWPGPTRLVRSQVLSLRERGYVRMALLSGMPPIKIILFEMLPNMLPWLAAAFTLAVSDAILTAASLEALGLGPPRIPTLGTTIYTAIYSSAIIRGLWWWWGPPIVVLVLIFASLFLITVGLDEIANPRLRGANG